MRKLEREDLEPNINDFASNALDGKYILIVGSSAVIKKDLFEGDGVKMLLDYALKAEYGSDESLLEKMRRECPTFTEWGSSETMHDNVRKAYCECKSQKMSDLVEPSLLKLMKTRLFRIVLTTTIDPIIEKVMDSVWGKGNYDIIAGPDDDNIMGVKLDQYKNILNRERPLLCYVLGRIREEKTSYKPYTYALTESEALNIMAKWLIKSTEGNSFMSSVRKEECLHVSIGCKFDDWLFRFFWYLITGEAGKRNKEIGQVVVDIDTGLAEDAVNSSLSRYLKREKSNVSFDDSRDFMKKAVKAIFEEKKKRLNACQQEVSNGLLFESDKPSIFLSYAHEDYSYVRRLYNKIIDEKVFDVWMDEHELYPGDDLKQKIETAIRDRCQYFVPVLSSIVWGILNDKQDRWVLNEWDIARNTLEQMKKDNKEGIKDRYFEIIPVVTCDFLNKDKGQMQYQSFVERCYLKEMHNNKTVYPEPLRCEGISDLIDYLKSKKVL